MQKERTQQRRGNSGELDERVLVLLAPEKAGEVSSSLREAGLSPDLCDGPEDAGGKISEGPAVILTDERTLLGNGVAGLKKSLGEQPPWSDIPIVLLSEEEKPSPDALEALGGRGPLSSFSIWAVPVETGNLILSVEAALRGRRHQYRVRDLLNEFRENEGRFRMMVDSAKDHAIFSLDPAGNITSWRVGAERVFGYTEDEIIGKSASMLFTEEDRKKGALAGEMERAAAKGVAEDNRWHMRKDGSRFWADGQMNPMVSPDGEIYGYTKILRDFTGRHRMESWLKALNETLEKRVEERTAVAERRAGLLRRLANELTNAEQRERRRLAQVLHDHLQQLLVAAKMQVGVLVMREADQTKEDHLHQVEDLLKRSIDTSRSLTVELSPPILYDAGLGPALEWLARRMLETHGLKVDLRRETDLNPSEENVRVFLFESIRELLFNVVKHAEVDAAFVSLRKADGRQLEVSVSDNGRGLDTTESGFGDGGFGLFSIRERIELLGGVFEIFSQPGEGTRLVLRVPVSQAVPEEPRGEEPGEEERAFRGEAPHTEVPDRIRILLADDHKILREGLAGLLREQPDFEVVSEASDGQMAVALARETRPDVIIMDVTMPILNGIDATRRIIQEMPHVKVIGLSMHEKEDMAQAMREAGAVAYVTKGAPSDILTATIRDCAAAKTTAS